MLAATLAGSLAASAGRGDSASVLAADQLRLSSEQPTVLDQLEEGMRTVLLGKDSVHTIETGFADDSGDSFLKLAAGTSEPMFGRNEVPEYVPKSFTPSNLNLNTYVGVRDPLPPECDDPSKLEDAWPCYPLKHRSEDEVRPVLPSLFIPGFPKSATTWLWDCMDSAFAPETVCPVQTSISTPPDYAWNNEACKGRRFYLPALTCGIDGKCKPSKELFFFNKAARLHTLSQDLPALFGPAVPLSYFAKTGPRQPPSMADAEWAKWKSGNMHDFCQNEVYTMLPNGTVHPGCRLYPGSTPELKLTAVQRALPWARDGQFNFATGDFTPNYMCSSRALHNIEKVPYGRKDDLRFIVMLREPMHRAFSEWSMFALEWQWDSDHDFHGRMAEQVTKLRVCNATLFNNTALLKRLPDAELFDYMDKCFPSQAMEYVGNSLYSVCVMAAQRIFKPEQFLFLRYEDLVRMQTPALLKMLSDFTGLYTDDSIISQVDAWGTCNARESGHPMAASTDSNQAAAMFNQTAKEFQPFFHEYDNLLKEIAGSSFQWSEAVGGTQFQFRKDR